MRLTHLPPDTTPRSASPDRRKTQKQECQRHRRCPDSPTRISRSAGSDSRASKKIIQARQLEGHEQLVETDQAPASAWMQSWQPSIGLCLEASPCSRCVSKNTCCTAQPGRMYSNTLQVIDILFTALSAVLYQFFRIHPQLEDNLVVDTVTKHNLRDCAVQTFFSSLLFCPRNCHPLFGHSTPT